jgi:hypothetical protein
VGPSAHLDITEKRRFLSLLGLELREKLLNFGWNKFATATTILHKITKKLKENVLSSTFGIRMIMN